MEVKQHQNDDYEEQVEELEDKVEMLEHSLS